MKFIAIVIIMLLSTASYATDVIEHSTCDLAFVGYEKIYELDQVVGNDLVNDLTSRGFNVTVFDGTIPKALRMAKALMQQDELVGFISMKARYDLVTIDGNDTEKQFKRPLYSEIRLTIEKLSNHEFGFFSEQSKAVAVGVALDDTYSQLFSMLPSCISEGESLAGEEEEESICHCRPGETHSQHVCHNRGVVEDPSFYFIQCVDGKPVMDPERPGYWQFTNITSCSIYPECCNSNKYLNYVPGTEKYIVTYCRELALSQHTF